MKVGYVRVSTEEQNTARQDTMMQELGVERVFVDKASGKNTERQALRDMLAFIRQGDVVVVESYSRLARNTRDLLDTVSAIHEKGAQFVSKKESIDTSTPAGRLMLTIFAGLAQFERECTLERQAEGIAEAKKAGKYKGRTPISVDQTRFENIYRQWKAGQATAVDAMRALGLKPGTFYRRVKEYEGRHK